MLLSDRTTTRWNEPPFVVRVTTDASRPSPLRSQEALLVRDRALECPSGFKMYFSLDDSPITSSNDARVATLPSTLSYVKDGDIVIVRPMTGGLRVMYRKSSNTTPLWVTL